jgi:uncharacterized protein (TIGR03067 family)
MRRTCAFLSTLLLASGIAIGGDAKDDMAKLKGTWVHEGDGKKHELKFTKGKFEITFSSSDKKGHVKGTIKIDPSQKPKHMDLTITDVDGVPDDFKGKTSHAIYDIDGDTLKWCANKPGDDGRAAAFPDNEGEGKYLYFRFKRAK